MRILLTGPSGFLGSALACYWAKCGHELILLARSSSRLDRLGELSQSVRVLRFSDISEIPSLIKDFSPDSIVHTACSYGRNREAPLDIINANLLFGSAVLQAILNEAEHVARPISFLNTATVLASDVSIYALSKNQFSEWGSALANQYPERLQFIDIRLQQMYGRGDDQSKFTTYVIEALRRNEPYLKLTAGAQRRDFIHIDDVVQAYDWILQQRAEFSTSDSIDVGSGQAVTMRDFVELAKCATGASTVLNFGVVPYRAKEPMLCVANTTRLRSLGWQLNVTLGDGLKRMIE